MTTLTTQKAQPTAPAAGTFLIDTNMGVIKVHANNRNQAYRLAANAGYQIRTVAPSRSQATT